MKHSIVIKKNEEKVLGYIHLFLAIFVIVWLNAGVFMIISSYIPNTVKLVTFSVWFLLACLKKGYLNSFFLKIWPLLVFYILIIAYNLLAPEISLQLMIKSIQYLMIIFSIYLYYSDTRKIIYKKITLVILFIDISFVGINTAFLLKNNPQLARILSSTPAMQEQLLGYNNFKAVANYGYFYGLVMIILLFFFRFTFVKKKKIFYGIMLLLSLYLLIQAQFTIAIIFTFLFILLIYLSKIFKGRTKVVILPIILIAFALSYLFLPNLIILISNLKIVPSEIAIRLKELSYISSNMEMGGTDVGSRFELYSKSLSAFGNNIFMGSFLNSSKVGGHSTWLDVLGLYGIFALLFFGFFYKIYSYMKTQYSNMNRTFINFIWLYFVFLGLVNTTLFSNIFIVLLIIIPYSISILENSEKEK